MQQHMGAVSARKPEHDCEHAYIHEMSLSILTSVKGYATGPNSVQEFKDFAIIRPEARETRGIEHEPRT